MRGRAYHIIVITGLCLLTTLIPCGKLGAQTPILRKPAIPTEAKIDLSDPNAFKGLDKKSKKKLKKARKNEKNRLKALNKKLDFQLDSLNALREKEGRKRALRNNLVRLKDLDGMNIPHKEKAKKMARYKKDSNQVKSLLKEYADENSGGQYSRISRFAIYKDSVRVIMNNDSIRNEFIKSLAANQAGLEGDSSRLDSFTGEEFLASKILSAEQMEAYRAGQMTKEDLVPNMDRYFEEYGIDPENLDYNQKEKIRTKAQELSYQNYVNHFAGNEDKLQKAQAGITAARKKKGFQEILQIFFDQQQESVKDKPLRKRFSLGGYLQYQRGKPDLLDVSPTIDYQVTGRITTGFGLTYRQALGKEPANSNQSQRIAEDVFGYRNYLEYDFLWGIYFHGEFESLKTKIPNQVGDGFRRERVNSFLFGIGKDFKITKGIRGSSQILYNFSHDPGRTPYPKPWQFRFGFKYN